MLGSLATNIHLDLLAIRVFNCRIVAFYPYVLYELRCAWSVSQSLLSPLSCPTYLLNSFFRLHLMRHHDQ